MEGNRGKGKGGIWREKESLVWIAKMRGKEFGGEKIGRI